MKNYEKRTVPEYEVSRHTKTTCDLCGAVSDSPDNWAGEPYAIEETELTVCVKHKDGTEYHHGEGYGTIYDVDLCPECFEKKLIPWLVSQGAKVERKEW